MCTGLEPIFLGMGASAATASVLATGAGALGAGALAKAATPKPPQMQVPTPEKPPQQTRAPNVEVLYGANKRAAGAGGAMAGNSSTFLTGPSGIDPKTLNLGYNTVLGR